MSMFNVVVEGKVIARAETALQSRIYTLNFLGVSNREIAVMLEIPLKQVTRFTEGGSTR